MAGSQEEDGQRVWVPVLDQTARTGVLALTVTHATEETLAQAELLGVFAGLVTAAAARVSDIPACGGAAARCRFRRACSGTCCRRCARGPPGR